VFIAEAWRRLFSAYLSNDDAVGAHAKAVNEQLTLTDGSKPLHVRRPGPRETIFSCASCQFGRIFDRNHRQTFDVIEKMRRTATRAGKYRSLGDQAANVEGLEAIRQRQLLINSLRMRPDASSWRGYARRSLRHASGNEHGHEGSMATIHATLRVMLCPDSNQW